MIYLDSKKIDEAADEMNYSIDHAKRIHSAALKAYQGKYYARKT